MGTNSMKKEEQFSYDHEREPMKYDDETIRKELKAIDEDDTVTVESNEADFIENILYKYPNSTLSAQQASWALNIIEKYER